jgi:hypothetical protein
MHTILSVLKYYKKPITPACFGAYCHTIREENNYIKRIIKTLVS